MPTIKRKKKKTNKWKKSHSAFPYSSKEWKAARALALEVNPYCVRCGKKADSVDKIEPVRLGGDPYDQRNLQSMCISCHNSKSATDGNKNRAKYKRL